MCLERDVVQNLLQHDVEVDATAVQHHVARPAMLDDIKQVVEEFALEVIEITYHLAYLL